jgi:hypothetical protein
MEAQTEALLKKFAFLSGKVSKEDLEAVRIKMELPVLMPLLANVQSAVTATDLTLKLLVNKTAIQFVTSDNPVVRYNQYWEDRPGISHVGWACQGLQVFLPISPSHMLLFYDGTIYKAGDKRSSIVEIPEEADVRQLNGLQWVNAQEVVLFSSGDSAGLRVEEGKPFLKHDGVFRKDVQTFASVDSDDPSVLLQLQTPQIRTGLKLSFLSVKRKKRKRPATTKVFVPRRQETEDVLRLFHKGVEAGVYGAHELNQFTQDLFAGNLRGR